MPNSSVVGSRLAFRSVRACIVFVTELPTCETSELQTVHRNDSIQRVDSLARKHKNINKVYGREPQGPSFFFFVMHHEPVTTVMVLVVLFNCSYILTTGNLTLVLHRLPNCLSYKAYNCLYVIENFLIGKQYLLLCLVK